MARRTLPSQEYLKQCFDYEPTTGVLTWRKRPPEHFKSYNYGFLAWNTQYAGTKAGTITCNKYWQVFIAGRQFLSHRVIWKMTTGNDPTVIDHRNCDGLDNRWANLRDGSTSNNIANSRKYKNKKSGLPKGVHRNVNGFAARIILMGKIIHLGTHKTPEEAAQAYRDAAVKYHGEFARFE